MKHVLHIVTGAPGAGKSTALAAFLGFNSRFIAFDIDWLTIPASNLAGKDIIFDPSTWPAYNALWFEVLHAVCRNRKQPVFFAPTDPHDIARYGQPSWCDQIEWLLLDCIDMLRQQRLKQRPEWTDLMVEEAIADASLLRETIHERIDTGVWPPHVVASKIHAWLERTST
jgi:hypothetical protein